MPPPPSAAKCGLCEVKWPCPFLLDNQLALITGGGSGLGLAMARCLAAAGARVVLAGRGVDKLKHAVTSIGPRAAFIAHDVTKLPEAPALVDKVGRRFGPITILINNAGIHLKKSAVDTTEEEFLKVLTTHVLGSHALSRAVAPSMMRHKAGSILLNAEHYQFALQCGCSHLVVHLVDYFRSSRANHSGDQPVGDDTGWGLAGDPGHLWTFDELAALKKEINAAGLQLEAIENFDPAHWHDVLLDGPKKPQQLENLKTLIRNVGRAGIPIFGYNFSIAGVAGRVKGPWGRGGAEVVGMDGPCDRPIPHGMVWNMVYDQNSPPGNLAPITQEELWRRHGDFLDALVPVAEEAGVTLAAHPDDPPLPSVRGQPRLANQPQLYQRLIDRRPSPHNALEFCLGTLAEMPDGNIYDAVETYSRQRKVAYVHFRNVRGEAPHYRETFVDEGDIDMPRLLRILKKNGFDGVLIPDHAPQMTCGAPWHAGMAFACGWMKAALRALEVDSTPNSP